MQKSRNEESLGAEYLEERENIRVEKLGLKINLVAILLPCVLVIVLAVVYYDLKSRLTTIQDTGTSKVENLSMDLDSQVRGLLGKYKSAEKNFNKEIKNSKKNISQIRYVLGRNSRNIKNISSSKVDKKEFKKEIDESRRTLLSIKKEISKSTAYLNDLRKKINSAEKSLKMVSGEIKSLDRNVSGNKKLLSALKREKADKNRIFAELRKERSLNSKSVESLEKIFKRKFNDLEKKIARLEKSKKRKKKTRRKKNTISKSKKPVKSKNKKVEPKIIESDIK